MVVTTEDLTSSVPILVVEVEKDDFKSRQKLLFVHFDRIKRCWYSNQDDIDAKRELLFIQLDLGGQVNYLKNKHEKSRDKNKGAWSTQLEYLSRNLIAQAKYYCPKQPYLGLFRPRNLETYARVANHLTLIVDYDWFEPTIHLMDERVKKEIETQFKLMNS